MAQDGIMGGHWTHTSRPALVRVPPNEDRFLRRLYPPPPGKSRRACRCLKLTGCADRPMQFGLWIGQLLNQLLRMDRIWRMTIAFATA